MTFIVNPNAGMGACGRQWPRLDRLARDLLGPFSCALTGCVGHATRLAREAIAEGAETIVSVGGDGTFNEVVNGFMEGDGPLRPDVTLGLIPIGTGCDLSKTLRIPARADEAMEAIRAGHARPMDLGRLTYRDNEGRTCVRHFHNVASFGLGGEVDERVNRTTKAFGGFVSFIWATVVSLLLYRKKGIRLQVDDGPEEWVHVWNVAVANGRYHGGGMEVAPNADPADGLFHVTIVGDLTLPEALWSLPRLYDGKILQVKKVRWLTGKRIEASSDQEVLIDLDGEQPGRLPARIEMVPAALRIITPDRP